MWGVSYWVFPVISGLAWLGTLLGLLIHWNVVGKPHYASMDANQHIAYISDVGAEKLKPLFITGACVTTVFLDLSFLSERWLRHRGRLAANTTMIEKILSGLSMVCAAVGTAGLILLSIFDTLRHPNLHDIFLVLFIAGYVLSAVFICAEYQRLGVHFRQHAVLRLSFWIKLAFILIEVGLAVAFGVCSKQKKYNAAAVLEWAVAFIFTFYVFSFFIDLLPAVHTKHSKTKFGDSAHETQMQMEQNDGYSREEGSRTGLYSSHGGLGAPAGINNARNTADSERTLGGNYVRTVNGVKYGEQAPVASNF